MFLEIADMIHLIVHQHQRTLNSNKNKNMKRISWFVLQSPIEKFLAPTFIVRRLLYAFKTMCICGRLLSFIKMTKFSFGQTSHHPIVPLQCCSVWKQIMCRSFVEIKILPMSFDRENLNFNQTNDLSGRIGN